MKSLQNNQVDVYEHVSLHVAALKFCQIWVYIPYPIKSVRFWWSILIRIVVGVLVFILPTCAQFVGLVKMLISGSAEIQEVVGVLNIILTEFLTSIKLLNLRLRRESLVQLLDQLTSEQHHHFDPVHTTILKKGIKLSRQLFVFFVASSLLDVGVQTIVVPALHGYEKLPLNMDFIFVDVTKEPYFMIMCIYQILCRPILVVAFNAIQTFTWAAMIYAISQLDILIYNLEHMEERIKMVRAERNCDQNEGFKEVFKSCVMHHRDITKFVHTIQSVFGDQVAYTLVLSACIIGTTGVQILSIESAIKNITVVVWVLLYLAVFILCLFIDCYFGNAVTYKSLHVATVAFAGPWLDLSKKEKKNFIIFIARTQQPLVITAAKLVPVSMATFTKVMNWTYKGFAVMNQMKK